MCILALDVGSSSVRAILFEVEDTGLKLIPDAIVQHHYTFDTDTTGRATTNPDTLRRLLETCITEILTHPAAKQIQAVGIDTFAGNIVAVNAQGQAISDLVTYADGRGKVHLDAIRPHIDIEQQHQRTGAPFHTAYYPAQLPLIASPEAATYMDFASYCYRHWFGQAVLMSYSIASWSGLLNRENLQWDTKYLQALNITASQFPPLADYKQAFYGYPTMPDVPFFLVVGDGAAAQVGSGAVMPDTATLTVGTTAAIRVVNTEKLPPVPQGCWSYRIDEAHHLIGGALSEGGNIFQWARQTLNLDLATLDAELQKRVVGSHGLIMLPMLNGERSPRWHPDATGVIQGLRLSTTPLDILQASLESVALRIAAMAQQLNLGSKTRIMASGGAMHASPLWAQMIADALGMAICLLDEPEVTALGTAQLTLDALQGNPIQGAKPRIQRIIEPDTNNHEIYKAMIEQQKALYMRLFYS